MTINEEAPALHEQWKGKRDTDAKAPIHSRRVQTGLINALKITGAKKEDLIMLEAFNPQVKVAVRAAVKVFIK